MTLGEQIIDELGRRGRRGMYFSYEGYNRLRRAENETQLRDFFASERFEDAPCAGSIVEIVDYLHRATSTVTSEDMMFLIALAMIGKLDHALQGLPVYYFYYMALRRKPLRRVIRWPWSKGSTTSQAAKP
jgi:hypothetical protein